MINNQKRIHTHGETEMIVKRRLRIHRELATNFGMKLQVAFVPSEKNKVDVLIMVKNP